MRVRKGTGAVLVWTLVMMGAPLVAQEKQKPPEMPKPSPEMAKLDFFEGTWTCEGKMNDSPMGPGGKMSSTVRVRDDLNGHFQSGSVKGTMANMPPFEGMFHTTYDSGAKQFVMLWVDNMGAWAKSNSSGWQGDKMAFEGEQHMGGQTMKGRDTFMRSGSDTMKHIFEAQMDGKWMTMGEETCKKTGK